MKRIIALGLCVIFLLSLPTSVLAKNFDKPPKSTDQIQVGDTYGKGDGELKIFNKDGKLIVHEKGKSANIGDFVNSLATSYDNGNYGGNTDIWWYYGGWDPFDFSSGPKGEATTYTWANDGISDYLEAYLKIYVSNVKKAEDNRHTHNASSVTASAEYLHYSNVGGPILACRGTTTHKVIDSSYGWNASFSTSDSF